MTGTLNWKRNVHILLPLFIGSVIAYLDRVNISFAKLTMNPDLGFGDAIFGMGAGIFYIGYVLFEVPGALVAERWSPRLWLARIMVSWGLISALMAFVRTEWQFYGVRFLLGAAEASYYPVAYASVIPRWYAPEERPRAIAVMLGSLQVSSIIGGPLAGWLLRTPLIGLKGWQVLFLVEAVPAVIFGVALYFWLADWPQRVSWLTEEEKAYLGEQYRCDLERKRGTRHYSVLEALGDREVLKLCLIYYLWITGFWGFGYWVPSVLESVSGWSALEVGWVLVIPMVLSLAAMIYVGVSGARTGEKRWHGAVPMFLGSVGLGIGTLVADPVMSLGFVCLAAIGVYAAFGVWWSYPTSFLSGSAAAGAVGLINSFGNIGGWVGPYLTGLVKEWTGSFQWAYLYLAVSLAGAGVLMLTLGRKRRIETT